MSVQVLKVDQELKELIPPMAAEEYKQLRENIIRDGCRDPISVWEGIILDGYTRYRICTDESIPFQTVEIRVADRDEAKKWMILNQLGKRNLRPGQISMLRGMLYNATKSKQGGSKAGKKTATAKKSKRTSEEIAEQTGVSERTVREDGAFVEAVEKVSAVDSEIKEKVMSGEATKSSIISAAKVVEENPEKAKNILNGNDKEEKEVSGGLNSGLDKIQDAIKESANLLKKVFVNEVIETLDKDGRQEAEMSLDAFIMKVDKLKEMLED